MKFKSTLLYAANLHVGGGIQVATSVIAEMLDLRKDDQDGMTIWASGPGSRMPNGPGCKS